MEDQGSVSSNSETFVGILLQLGRCQDKPQNSGTVLAIPTIGNCAKGTVFIDAYCNNLLLQQDCYSRQTLCTATLAPETVSLEKARNCSHSIITQLTWHDVELQC